MINFGENNWYTAPPCGGGGFTTAGGAGAAGGGDLADLTPSSTARQKA